jgi:hypothetical protein
LTGRRPEWLTTVFGFGYIGAGHATQAKYSLNDPAVSFALYGVCVVLGLITGRCVRRLTDRLTERGAKADRIPRIFSVFIVLSGWVVGSLPGTSAVPASAHQWTAEWLWIAAGALLVLLACVGEAFTYWFPAREPEPVTPPVPAPPVPAPSLRRRWRQRPDTA